MSGWDGTWPVPGIAFGGDYNPEQWPEEVWREDVALMREAGVTLVSVGIFSWGLLEPEPGRYDWGWLDRVLDLLHEGGIGVDLATPSAAPPIWLALEHPEMLPVDEAGLRFTQGSRETWCPSSPVLREHSVRIARALAERYGQHPAVRMWHVSNEYGCHNGRCWCDVSAAAFRDWLRERYGDVAALNDAWGTAFWGQHYGSFDQVLPPRRSTSIGNPGQQLDFARFSSDALVAQLEAEAAVLREVTPHLPVTTNYMVMSDFDKVDYVAMGRHVDLVANDHYLTSELPRNWADLAFSADRTRGLAAGRPWLLMEHSTSAVNWQPRNLAKAPGEMARNSLAHVARGADGALFFQWRQSRAGAEKYHSAMLPHAGRESRIFREVVELGATLGRLAPVAGSLVDQAPVAILWDADSWWASTLDAHPTGDFVYLELAARMHAALADAGFRADVLPAGAPLDGYAAVLVPTLYIAPEGLPQRLAEVVERGGQVVVSYFSGIADERDHVLPGGYPGAFRDLLGVLVDEFTPLGAGATVTVEEADEGWAEGTAGGPARTWHARLWAERLAATDATVVARYADGPAAGGPAVTRRAVGAGAAWYLSTMPDEEATAALLTRVLADAGVSPTPGAGPGVEVVRRTGEAGSFVFVVNHTQHEARVPLTGEDLVAEGPYPGTVAPGGVAVVREG